MNRRIARILASASAAIGIGAAGIVGVGPASADTADEQFADAVAELGISVPADVDVTAVGRGICDSLTAGQANPAPVVRGVVSRLQGTGLDRGQAVGMMRASVAFYCPQYSRIVGR